MNILTFDIEEWALAKAGGYGTAERYADYDGYLKRILDMLEMQGINATFFCTGLMAQDFPHVVKLIHSKGHEIGCHSHCHTWMNKMTKAEAREDTHAAVVSLEQCIGEKVVSYRAPAFSIGDNNKWMFEILAENGITLDASIYPATRDFGGFPQFKEHIPTLVNYQGITIKEFPIPTMKVFGKKLAYSGGGYFRFFPLWFIKDCMKSGDYHMFYFHIGDLLPGPNKVMSKEDYEGYFREPGTIINRYKRYIKASLGRKGIFEKMETIISSDIFIGLQEANNHIDWNTSPFVNL